MGQGDVYLEAEGRYKSWTISGIYDTGVPLSISDTIAIRDAGYPAARGPQLPTVFWHNDAAHTAYIISSAGELLATITHLGVSGFSRLASILDKFRLLPKWNDADNAVTKLCVQEGLTELWEREVDSDKGEYTLAADPVDVGLLAISPSGEYIAAIIKEDGDNGLIFIYKGS